MTGKPRILVIENDTAFVSLLQPMLQKLAVEVVVAEDGAHARNALASSSFDLVTLAYQLPDADGLELLEEISSKDQHTPVIMVTGYGDEATAARAFKAGAAGYMVKDSRLLRMLPLVLGKALDAVRLEDALRDSGVSDHRIFEEAIQKIRESEELYRTLVRVSPDAITITDLEGKITFASDRTVELYRFESPDELVGMSAFGLIVEEEHEKTRTYMKRALEGSVARNLEYTMRRRDGSTFVGGLNVSLLRNHSGEPSGFMTTVRDMTERRETQALKASAQTLQTIFDSMPGLLFFKNKDNVIVRANMKLADSLGMKVEETKEGRGLSCSRNIRRSTGRTTSRS
jgi:PAS domain S-box-containing protein